MLILPLCTGAVAATMPAARKALAVMCTGILLTAGFGWWSVVHVVCHGTLFAASDWLFLDALSAYNLAIMLLVFSLCACYAYVYFSCELRRGQLTLRQARLFTALFSGSFSTMALVLIANNLSIMWVSLEATTLVTTFLIYLHSSRQSLEAMWKYLIICSVGMAFAFMGTLLAAAAAVKGGSVEGAQALLWTHLVGRASLCDPMLMKAAFIFLLIGYGTKAGLAPMHNWLPDAHSQAPAPVSALFSGFMLSASLYCIMRYLPIVSSAIGSPRWATNLLILFGIVSLLVAAAFIIFQHDVKRLFAYSSVEHMGIIALGLGLGNAGVFTALFHTLNHSLGKTLAFFSAGRLGQIFKTTDMGQMRGVMRISRVWGFGLFISVLALIGAAPFSIFMSEFQTVKAALDAGNVTAAVLFLFGAGIVFMGVLAHLIPVFWARNESDVSLVTTGLLEKFLVFFPGVLLLFLGIWMPDFLHGAIDRAAAIILSGGN